MAGLVTFGDLINYVQRNLKVGTESTSESDIKLLLNSTYVHEVVPYHRWNWLFDTTTVTAESYYATGSVTVTQGSTTVTFSADPGVSKTGFFFAVDGQNEIYRIDSHTANSGTMELAEEYVGETNATANFKVFKVRYDLPVDVGQVTGVYVDGTNNELQSYGKQDFRRISKQSPKAEGSPSLYTMNVDSAGTDELTGSDTYRELWIHPSINNKKTRLVVDYQRQVEFMDATTDEPVLPIEHRIVLAYGALAEAWNTIGRNQEQAIFYQQKYTAYLRRMAGKKHENPDKLQLRVSPRYYGGKRRLRRGKGLSPDIVGSGSSGSTAADTIKGTANRATEFDANGELTASAVTSTELGYLDGATSNIQAQLDTLSAENLDFLDDTIERTSLNLTDNTTDATVVEIDAGTYSGAKIFYSVKRSNEREYGEFNIVHDGTTASVSHERDRTADLGVTFDVTLSGGNVVLRYTTTSTGNDATMIYKGHRL